MRDGPHEVLVHQDGGTDRRDHRANAEGGGALAVDDGGGRGAALVGNVGRVEGCGGQSLEDGDAAYRCDGPGDLDRQLVFCRSGEKGWTHELAVAVLTEDESLDGVGGNLFVSVQALD